MKFSLSGATLLFGASAFQSAIAEEHPEFTYKSDSDALSPSEWAEGYPTCGGSKQSPIDITESTLCSVYNPVPGSLDGYCPDYTMTEDSESYKAATYNFAQFHVHTPSEHTIDGKAYDGEIHYVHKREDGSGALVIGLFLEKIDGNDTEPAIDIIVDAMSEVSPTNSIHITLYVFPSLLRFQENR
ncbi:unnamed protein product [Phytophthora lilii]|uniref:carbonic anhydrase n=1 Tax=Phytophthora lilii TaxID=2077276 RepID=A0A9W6TPU3_9STRA|nr:unnamed protein product [Phytophthora lilii]